MWAAFYHWKVSISSTYKDMCSMSSVLCSSYSVNAGSRDLVVLVLVVDFFGKSREQWSSQQMNVLVSIYKTEEIKDPLF